jgi:hypothetical protein
LFASTTVRTPGATDSMAMTARIERMSASLLRLAGKTIAELASRIPHRSRSSVLVMSPRTK